MYNWQCLIVTSFLNVKAFYIIKLCWIVNLYTLLIIENAMGMPELK